jgi:hypothetical protein
VRQKRQAQAKLKTCGSMLVIAGVAHVQQTPQYLTLAEFQLKEARGFYRVDRPTLRACIE